MCELTKVFTVTNMNFQTTVANLMTVFIEPLVRCTVRIIKMRFGIGAQLNEDPDPSSRIYITGNPEMFFTVQFTLQCSMWPIHQVSVI